MIGKKTWTDEQFKQGYSSVTKESVSPAKVGLNTQESGGGRKQNRKGGKGQSNASESKGAAGVS